MKQKAGKHNPTHLVRRFIALTLFLLLSFEAVPIGALAAEQAGEAIQASDAAEEEGTLAQAAGSFEDSEKEEASESLTEEGKVEVETSADLVDGELSDAAGVDAPEASAGAVKEQGSSEETGDASAPEDEVSVLEKEEEDDLSDAGEKAVAAPEKDGEGSGETGGEEASEEAAGAITNLGAGSGYDSTLTLEVYTQKADGNKLAARQDFGTQGENLISISVGDYCEYTFAHSTSVVNKYEGVIHYNEANGYPEFDLIGALGQDNMVATFWSYESQPDGNYSYSAKEDFDFGSVFSFPADSQYLADKAIQERKLTLYVVYWKRSFLSGNVYTMCEGASSGQKPVVSLNGTDLVSLQKPDGTVSACSYSNGVFHFDVTHNISGGYLPQYDLVAKLDDSVAYEHVAWYAESAWDEVNGIFTKEPLDEDASYRIVGKVDDLINEDDCVVYAYYYNDYNGRGSVPKPLTLNLHYYRQNPALPQPVAFESESVLVSTESAQTPSGGSVEVKTSALSTDKKSQTIKFSYVTATPNFPTIPLTVPLSVGGYTFVGWYGASAYDTSSGVLNVSETPLGASTTYTLSFDDGLADSMDLYLFYKNDSTDIASVTLEAITDASQLPGTVDQSEYPLTTPWKTDSGPYLLYLSPNAPEYMYFHAIPRNSTGAEIATNTNVYPGELKEYFRSNVRLTTAGEIVSIDYMGADGQGYPCWRVSALKQGDAALRVTYTESAAKSLSASASVTVQAGFSLSFASSPSVYNIFIDKLPASKQWDVKKKLTLAPPAARLKEYRWMIGVGDAGGNDIKWKSSWDPADTTDGVEESGVDWASDPQPSVSCGNADGNFFSLDGVGLLTANKPTDAEHTYFLGVVAMMQGGEGVLKNANDEVIYATHQIRIYEKASDVENTHLVSFAVHTMQENDAGKAVAMAPWRVDETTAERKDQFISLAWAETSLNQLSPIEPNWEKSKLADGILVFDVSYSYIDSNSDEILIDPSSHVLTLTAQNGDESNELIRQYDFRAWYGTANSAEKASKTSVAGIISRSPSFRYMHVAGDYTGMGYVDGEDAALWVFYTRKRPADFDFTLMNTAAQFASDDRNRTDATNPSFTPAAQEEDPDEYTLYISPGEPDHFYLNAHIYAVNAESKQDTSLLVESMREVISWTSSDESIATVAAPGKNTRDAGGNPYVVIEAKAAGEVLISATVECEGGTGSTGTQNITHSIRVIVSQPARNFNFKKDVYTLYLNTGRSVSLNLKDEINLLPEGAVADEYRWMIGYDDGSGNGIKWAAKWGWNADAGTMDTTGKSIDSVRWETDAKNGDEEDAAQEVSFSDENGLAMEISGSGIASFYSTTETGETSATAPSFYIAAVIRSGSPNELLKDSNENVIYRTIRIKVEKSIEEIEAWGNGLTKKKTEIWLAVGDKTRLYYSLTPSSATFPRDQVTWAKDAHNDRPDDILGVTSWQAQSDGSGNYYVEVTGKAEGDVDLACWAEMKHSNTITVHVRPYTLTLNRTAVSVAVGSKDTAIVATCSLPDERYTNIVWEPSDEEIAAPAPDNALTTYIDARKPGTVTFTITASTKDPAAGGSWPDNISYVERKVKAECTVIVNPIPVSQIIFQKNTGTEGTLSFAELLSTDKKLYVGKSATFYGQALPSNASNKLLYFSSSDTGVAEIVSTQRPGVSSAASGSESHTKVTIRAIAPGTATITAQATDGSGISASIEITVVTGVESISIARIHAAVSRGESYDPDTDPEAIEEKTVWINTVQEFWLYLEILPENATASEARLTWSTIDPDDRAYESLAIEVSAGYDSQGNPVGVLSYKTGGGTQEEGVYGIVRVETADGKSDEITVHIQDQKVSEIAFYRAADDAAFSAGETQTQFKGVTASYYAKVTPEIARNRKLNWTYPSDITVFTYEDSNGNPMIDVTGATAGTYTIRADADDGGGAFAYFYVQINNPVTGIKIYADSARQTEVTAPIYIEPTAAVRTVNLWWDVDVIRTAGFYDEQVIWESSDPEVIKFRVSGQEDADSVTLSAGPVTLAALKGGGSVITARAADGSGVSASVNIVVKFPEITGFTLRRGDTAIAAASDEAVPDYALPSISLQVGARETLDAVLKYTSESIAPEDITVEWTPDNPGMLGVSVTAVEGSGTDAAYSRAVLLGNREGSLTLTIATKATHRDAKGNNTPYFVKLKVNITEPENIGPNEVLLLDSAIEMPVGGVQALNLRYGANVSPTDLTFASSNSRLLSVDKSGLLRAAAKGNVQVSVYYGTERVGSCDVSIYTALTGLTLSSASLELLLTGVENTASITAKASPAELENVRFSWSVADTACAEGRNSSSSGNTASCILFARAVGSTLLTCTAEDDHGNTLSAYCMITVRGGAASLALENFPNTVLAPGEVIDLHVLAANDPGVIRFSLTQDPAESGKQVVAVSNAEVNGKYVMQVLNPGKASLQLFSEDGKVSSPVYTCTVEKTVPLKGFTVYHEGKKASKLQVYLPNNGTSVTLDFTVNYNPANVSPAHKTVLWSPAPTEKAENAVTEKVNEAANAVLSVRPTDPFGASARATVSAPGKATITAVNGNYSTQIEVEAFRSIDGIRMFRYNPSGAASSSSVGATGREWLSTQSVTLQAGDTLALKAVPIPEDTTDARVVSWSVVDKSKGKVASVSPEGLVKAESEGTARIRASIRSSGSGTQKTIEAFVDVEVFDVKNPAGGDRFLGGSLNKTSAVLTDIDTKGDATTRGRAVLDLVLRIPSGKNSYVNRAVTWDVVGPSGILSPVSTGTNTGNLDASGLATRSFTTAKKAGTVYVRAVLTGQNKKGASISQTLSCKVTVNKPVTEVKLVQDKRGTSYGLATYVPEEVYDACAVKVGEKAQYAAVFYPPDATNASGISWRSTKPGFAAVSAGTVLGRAPSGSEEVLIYAKAGGVDCSNPLSVQVSGYPTAISISRSSLTLKAGASAQLGAKLYPASLARSAIGKMYWTSSDERIATVSDKGRVQVLSSAAGGGFSDITCSWAAEDGKKTLSVSCRVQVTKAVSSVYLENNMKEALLYVNPGTGEYAELRLPDVLTVPADATNTGDASWKSSDPKLVAIEGGMFKVGEKASAGKATLTATVGKKKAKLVVIVKQHAEALCLSGSRSIAMLSGKTASWSIAYDKKTVTDDKKKTAWASEDPDLAAPLSASGSTARIRAYKPGIARLILTDPDSPELPESARTIRVLISDPVKKLSFVSSARTVSAGGTMLSPEVLATWQDGRMENVAAPKVLWKSANEKLAKVADDGTITLLATGKVNITATYGGKKAVLALTIR